MSLDGSGALALLGQNPIPQGTPDELRQIGVDPSAVGSCAPRSPGVRGCPLWDECPFDRAKFGGFKGHGPRYIGYYLKTHEGKQAENFMLCHAFTRVMLSRMRTGNQQHEEGKQNAEIIRIIAQEGGTVRQRGGHPVDPNDHRPTARYINRTEVVSVPEWPRPNQRQSVTYEAELWHDEMARRNADPEFATGPVRVPDDEPDEVFNDSGNELAAPVRRRGRPPGSKNRTEAGVEPTGT